MTRVVVRTPLRVSFFGGGTDLPGIYQKWGGRVLGVALARYTYVTLDTDGAREVSLEWDGGSERVARTQELRHGIVREALLASGIDAPIAVRTVSFASPVGSGLGASASIAVGTLLAGAALAGRILEPEELAERACDLEIDRLGLPVGKQDQYFAALGSLRHFRFLKSGKVVPEPLTLSERDFGELEKRALLIHIGARTDSMQILNLMQGAQTRRATEWCRMSQLALAGATALAGADWDGFASLLREAWDLKRSLAPASSNWRVEAAAEYVLRNGADAIKLLGAGGGGWLLAFSTDPTRLERLRNSLTGRVTWPLTIAIEGSTILTGDSTRRLPSARVREQPERVGAV